MIKKLNHQIGATRPAYGPKGPFWALLDPVWPHIWPKWLEQECSPLEQVNPYQNEAENIISCHGKPTSKRPPSLTHCVMIMRKDNRRSRSKNNIDFKSWQKWQEIWFAHNIPKQYDWTHVDIGNFIFCKRRMDVLDKSWKGSGHPVLSSST